MEEALVKDRQFVWRAADVLKLYLYIGVLIVAFAKCPNNIWDGAAGHIIVVLGTLGTWRYSWWFTHFIRAQIYQRSVFPRTRRKADRLWNSGWRPERLYFMMTTFNEQRETTEKVILSIIREAREVSVPTTVFVGTAVSFDEEVIETTINLFAKDLDLEVIFVRQNQQGKRIAMGLALRAMSRKEVASDSPVVFMDGDSILAPGCLRKCLPIFHLYPKVHALTTNEKSIVFGHNWMQKWFDLRLAQRHMVMHSHALSKKVLTLTGRMSIFRAAKTVEAGFISMVESDNLNHWLWGRFRFLSGDDKSTWYWLVRERAQMLYIPDALVYTVDHVDPGTLYKRVVQNMLRWSGNMLRNGARVIALGPKHVGPFIWWCVVDQRLVMWTTLVGPIAMVLASIVISPLVFWAFLIWVLTSRLLLSMAFFYYHGRIDMSFPFILFANQIVGAVIKIYVLFRLPQQRWANRGDQRINFGIGSAWRIKKLMATYITFLYVSIFVFFIFTIFLQLGRG
jgi:glycosyltransferase Alg8